MNLRYHKWLEIEVTHTYFVDNICSVLNLVPTAATAHLFKNYQILAKRHANTLSFYVGLVEGATLDILTQFEGISSLYFQVMQEDSLFFSYTDIEFSREEKLLFFSNLNKNAGATQLQLGQFTNASNLLTRRPEVFALNLKPSDTQLEIKALDGRTVILEDVSNAENPNYTINLSGQESAVYQLFLNSELIDLFFMTPERLDSYTIGVIQIDMHSLKQNYMDGFTYQLAFDARAVHRQYKIVLPTTRQIDVSTIEIKGMENEKYNGPVKENLMGDQMVEVFTSDIPLKLKIQLEKHPQLYMTYTSELSNRANDLELKLPNPSAENISKNNNESDEVSFVSSTIIYV